MRGHALSLLVLAALASAPAADASFTFQIPAGFKDLSPGLPESTYADLDPGLVAEIKSGKDTSFAMEFGEPDGFFENFNAAVSQGALVIDEAAVQQWRQRLTTEYSKVMGGPVTVIEVTLASVGGVPSIRAIFDSSLPQVQMRQMQYVVPGGNEFAVLTYSSTPEKFDDYVQVFDAAAMATLGAEKAKVIDWWRSARVGMYGGAIGLLVGLVAYVASRRGGGGRRMPPPRPGRRMPPRPAPRR